MYQRVITLTFKDELSKEAITNYLQPVIKEQGEATRKAGAKVDIKEAYVYRAWFDGTDDMKSLTNF